MRARGSTPSRSTGPTGVVFLDEPGWTVVGPGVGEADGHGARGGLDL